jgi:integrase
LHKNSKNLKKFVEKFWKQKCIFALLLHKSWTNVLYTFVFQNFMMKERTVEEVEGFCGWDFLLSLVRVFDFPPYRGLVACLFETGGRISEVLELRRENFNLSHPKVVVVERMPVLKRYEVVGRQPDPSKKSGFRWLTSGVRDYRYFPIRRDEPLVPYMLQWVEKCGEGEKLFEFDRYQALKLLREAGAALNTPIPFTRHRRENRPLHSSEIFPHLLRAERACQLAAEYSFDAYALRQFFGWKPRKLDMAEKYASLDWRSLAKRMGVPVEGNHCGW